MPVNKLSTVFQSYLSRFFFRPPILLHSFFKERWPGDSSPHIPTQIKQLWSDSINPFNLCPRSLVFWFLILPYSAVGVAVLSLHHVVFYWRQQLEPNETIYVMHKISELRVPFPLTLFTLFSALGLVLTGSTYTIYETLRNLSAADSTNSTKSSSFINPFNLTPRMSIYFPIYENHTTMGFLDIDFRHAEISIKQSLEPNDGVLSLIRFLDLYAPFPIMTGLMILSVGLFITGIIYENNQELKLPCQR